MSKHHVILIGGALALLWYVKSKNAGVKPTAAAVAASAAPNASTTYTTTQSEQAAQWWNYAGSWQV